MFKSLNLTAKKIYENDLNQALFLDACGHLKRYIDFSNYLLAQPGDRLYERNINEIILGKDYLNKEKTRHGKLCVKDLLRMKVVEGFLKSYNIKTEKGHYEDQELVLDAFEKYIRSVNFSLEGRRFFEEAGKLLKNY